MLTLETVSVILVIMGTSCNMVWKGEPASVPASGQEKNQYVNVSDNYMSQSQSLYKRLLL